MTTVTVFRRVPQPIIGVCGFVPDRAFDAFEESLDWLESTGILVERFDPASQPSEVAPFDDVVKRLAREGERCLPIILVDGEVASAAVRPTRSQLARIVGQSRREAGLPAIR